LHPYDASGRTYLSSAAKNGIPAQKRAISSVGQRIKPAACLLELRMDAMTWMQSPAVATVS
jgi:hypothetical protein